MLLYDYFRRNRRIGYSTCLKEIADPRVRILCPDIESAKRFGDKGIILADLEDRKDGKDWIVLLDNHFILKFLEAIQQEQQEQQKRINRLTECIAKIQTAIEEI